MYTITCSCFKVVEEYFADVVVPVVEEVVHVSEEVVHIVEEIKTHI